MARVGVMIIPDPSASPNNALFRMNKHADPH